jgi:hypothetical protein
MTNLGLVIEHAHLCPTLLEIDLCAQRSKQTVEPIEFGGFSELFAGLTRGGGCGGEGRERV